MRHLPAWTNPFSHLLFQALEGGSHWGFEYCRLSLIICLFCIINNSWPLFHLPWFPIYILHQERGHSERTRSEFEKELNENKVQFARIRNKNVNFILCQFHMFVLYLQKECLEFLF